MKEAYYFSHDANARHDPKVVAMMARYGVEGYGRYWIIIEMLREDADHRLQIGSAYMRNALAVQMQCDPDAALKFVQDCITEFELFETDDEYFWSNSLLRRMDMRKARSDQARAAAKARWEGKKKPKKEKKNADAMRQHSVSNATAMQLKERKGNIKESTSTPPIVPPAKPQSERIKTDDDNGNKDLKTIYDAFSENIHPVTPMEAEDLAEWIDDGMSPGAVIWAIKEAVRYNKRYMKYIRGILSSLKAEGITTAAGAEARERNRADAKRQEPGKAREPTRMPPPSPEEKKKIRELTRLLAEKTSLDAALDEKTETEEVPPWLQQPETG